MLFFTNCRIRLCVPHNLSLDLFEMKSPLASDTRSSYTHSLETHINPADIGQHTGTRNAKHKSLTQLSLTHTHRYEAPPFPFLALPPLLLFLEGGCVCYPPARVFRTSRSSSILLVLPIDIFMLASCQNGR